MPTITFITLMTFYKIAKTRAVNCEYILFNLQLQTPRSERRMIIDIFLDMSPQITD